MIFGSIKSGIITALGAVVAFLAALALYFRGNAAAAKERLKDRNMRAAQAQAEQVQDANKASEEADKQGKQDIKNATDKANNGANTFNDW